MITPYLPYPLLSGGQTRSYNLIKNLAKKHDITLFAFIREDEERNYIPELEKYCAKVKVFKRRKAWSPINIFLSGITPYPFLVSIYLSQSVKKAVAQELSEEKYHLIHAETFYVMPNIPETNLSKVLVEQTIEYAVYKHYVQHEAPWFLRPLLWIDVQKIKRWEKHFWQQAKRIVAMSESDKQSILELSPNLSVDIVPNGVDVDWFSEKEQKKQGKIVLYAGYFKWLQNREAALYLVSKVWPKIRKEVNGASLWVVGRGMSDEIRGLARKDIKISENIDDIRDAYANADVLLAPIKGPGGTRLKILEALASGTPVVTTSVGAEGLDVQDGKQALIRDSAPELARATIKILKDKSLANSLASEGKRLVANLYSWAVSAQKLDKIYKEAASK